MKYRARLTVLTPLHIGSGDELKSAEFYCDGGLLAVVDMQKLLSTLLEDGRISQFADYVASNDSRQSLTAFLQKAYGRQALDLVRRCSKRIVAVATDLETQRNITSFRPHICDPLSGRPYIPGSSIKGAIRSAVLYLMLLNENAPIQSIIGRLAASGHTYKNREIGRELDEVLQKHGLRSTKSAQGPHKDLLRCLHISDAFTEEKDCSEVVACRIASLNNGGGYHFSPHEKPATLYVETLRAGTQFTFTVEVDDWLLSLFEVKLRVSFIEFVNKSLEAKANKLLGEEARFYQQAGLKPVIMTLHKLKNDSANLRIGFGSGLLGTSQVLHLSDDQRRALRRFLGSRGSSELFPQSRKLVVDPKGQPQSPLGWAKVEFFEVAN